MNSDLRPEYLQSGLTIHEFFAAASMALNRDLVIAVNPARIVVLRDPLARLVSCYQNKFVRLAEHDPVMAPTIERVVAEVNAQKGGNPDPTLGINFSDFVNYVARISDVQCDTHWLPQSRICGKDMSIYAHVGRFESLNDTLDFLNERFGMEPVTDITGHVRFPESHATKYDPQSPLRNPWLCSPAELRANDAGFPIAEAFYNDRLRRAVLERYSDDAALHACA